MDNSLGLFCGHEVGEVRDHAEETRGSVSRDVVGYGEVMEDYQTDLFAKEKFLKFLLLLKEGDILCS